MGSLGDSFWNVRDADDLRRRASLEPLDNTGDVDVRRALQAVLNRAAGALDGATPTATDLSRGGSGGVIFFPPGVYRVGWDASLHARGTTFSEAVDKPDIWVRPNVDLWFAPGATLRLAPEVVVRIEGGLRADAHHVFDAPEPTSPLERRGRVVFQTTAVTELRPEWWGAVSLPDGTAFARANTRAFEDCIRAAHTDRAFAHGRKFPVVPIVLMGSYLIEHELVVESRGPRPRFALDGSITREPDPSRWLSLREVSGVANHDGIVLLGRRATGSIGAVPAALKASASFVTGDESASEGRALLRIAGLHGSLVEGVAFHAEGRPPSPESPALRASACVQLTGNNARATTFRDCAFYLARDVLFQAGDYVLEDPSQPPHVAGERRLPTAPRAVPVMTACLIDGAPRDVTLYKPHNGGWDLTGLTLENCTFHSELPLQEPPARDASDIACRTRALRERLLRGDGQHPGEAYRVVGLVFHASESLPITLDRCTFTGAMLACVEAYGGALVVRGGTTQNQLRARPYSEPSTVTRERPRGGVDFFIGDFVLPTGAFAQGPTGLTVMGFQSQSDQLLDTFRHWSASHARVPFMPTLLEGVVQNKTHPIDAPDGADPCDDYAAPPAIVWSGPGLWRADVPMTRATRPSTLTLVACAFAGPRLDVRADVRAVGEREPSGVIVADASTFLIADVGTSFHYETPSPVYQRRRSRASERFEAQEGMVRFPWYRSL